MTINMSFKNFVAVNYIDCKPEYRERFEELFATRAKQIDTMRSCRYAGFTPDERG